MVSKIEHRLLIALFAVSILLGTVRTIDWMIWSYQRSVEASEREKERLASGRDKIQFSGCNPCTPKAFEQILPIQSLLLLFAAVLFWTRRAAGILFSLSVLLVLLYGYYDWSRETSLIYLGTEISFPYSYQSYLLFNSTKIDIFVLLCTFSLLVLQIGLIVRFAAEKLHARLTPSDKTLST